MALLWRVAASRIRPERECTSPAWTIADSTCRATPVSSCSFRMLAAGACARFKLPWQSPQQSNQSTDLVQPHTLCSVGSASGWNGGWNHAPAAVITTTGPHYLSSAELDTYISAAAESQTRLQHILPVRSAQAKRHVT